MQITIDLGKDFFSAISDAVAEGIRRANQPAKPEKVIKKTAGDLIKLVNESVKDVDPQKGKQNREIIKAVFAEHGASKVPEVPDNEIGEVCRKIEERRVA
jgi:O-methyltransferase involved in polyketide biosynthesis